MPRPGLFRRPNLHPEPHPRSLPSAIGRGAMRVTVLAVACLAIVVLPVVVLGHAHPAIAEDPNPANPNPADPNPATPDAEVSDADRSAQETEPIRKIDFSRDIQPILASRCFSCHGPDVNEGGLRLTGFDEATAECDSGDFAIVAGDPDASMILERITSDDEFERMPPEGEPLKEEQVELLRAWIEQGATYTKHWAFRPRQHPQPPQLNPGDMAGWPGDDHRSDGDRSDGDRGGTSASWEDHPIDAFIAKRLIEHGLPPAPPADRKTLIRRMAYDLTGLPPTAEQIERFVRDDRPDAVGRLADRLLASPHYGERWGRHWLDLVRYAETNSFERDGPKPNAWKYRDYVVDALNRDKSYFDFVREQIAGDELDQVTDESLTATGYYRLGIWDDEPADPQQAKFDQFDDLITTTGQAFLGLTINCARCHDHKIDPIPQADYYAMLAFLADVTPYAQRSDLVGNNQIDISPQWLRKRYAELDEEQRSLEKQIRDIEQASIAKMSAPDQRATEGPKRQRRKVLAKRMAEFTEAQTMVRYRELKSKLAASISAEKELPERSSVLGLAKTRRVPETTFVLFRGNPGSPTDEVSPMFPSLFEASRPTIPEPAASQDSAGRRRVLADWLADPDHDLAPRVIANRVWQFHFGRGIVRSSNNMGRLGTPPTHPELLDFLADELARGDGSLKRLHRMMVTSRTYAQQSAVDNPTAIKKDPANDLYWRFDPRRLSAEEVRDSILAVCGSLNHAVGGPSVYPQLSAEVLAGQSRPGAGWGKSSPADQNRRSVYIHVKRSLITPLLAAFDFPDPDQTCEARFETLGPNQALALLNADWMQQRAADLIAHLNLESATPQQLADGIIAEVLRRDASDAERDAAAALVGDLIAAGLSPDDARRWYALSVMNWNEFLFLD